MDGVGATMVFDRGIVKPGQDAGMDESGNWATNGQFNLGSQPFLKVDRNGERIANESANYDAIPSPPLRIPAACGARCSM